MTDLKYGDRGYAFQIRVVSPLHIWSGRSLVENIDYVYANGAYWIIDLDRLLDLLDPGQDAYLLSRLDTGEALSRVLNINDLTDISARDPRAVYRIAGSEQPNSRQITDRLVREHIKDMRGRAYIPGSTIKGMIRTILAYQAWEQRGLRLNVDSLGKGARFAAEETEAAMFVPARVRRGNRPNFDIMRAIRVRDSQSTDAKLRVTQVRVLSESSPRGDIYLETLQPNTVFTLQVWLNDFLRRDERVRQEMGWDDAHLDLLKLKRLPAIASAMTELRIQEELARWSPTTETFQFYDRLRELHDARNRDTDFFIQLGWGGGWDKNTLNHRLRKDAAQFQRLVERFGVVHKHPTERQPPFVFHQNWRIPKSRRVVVRQNQDEEDLHAEPLGWVRVRLTAM